VPPHDFDRIASALRGGAGAVSRAAATTPNTADRP
jgi:hypothetical protein